MTALFAYSLAQAGQNAADLTKPTISRERARVFLETERMLDDAQPNYYRRLIKMFGEHDFYTPAQLIAVRKPEISSLRAAAPQKMDQPGDGPLETFTKSALDERYATLEMLDPESAGARDRLIARAGSQGHYRADQVRDAELRPSDKEPDPEALARELAINTAREAGAKRALRAKEGWRFPLIRHDWRDVLYDEDPSQRPEKKIAAIGDLTGAQFSFARDGQSNSDTWTAQGAVIVPYLRSFEPGPGFGLRTIAVAPSVSLNRITSNGDPQAEQDSLFYRLGVYMDLFGRIGGKRPTELPTSQEDIDVRLDSAFDPVGLQIRAAGVYATDFDSDAKLPGFEVDIEPRWWGTHFAIGYRKVLFPKVPLKKDGSDSSLLDYQLRIWLHTEGGNIQSAGPAWSPVEGSFFRLGPVVQFQLEAPKLLFGHSVSITTLYSYLAAISGPDDHESYFRGTLTYNLLRDPELNHKVTLNANYQRGGLNFTKQEVDTFTIGLGVLY